MKKVWFSMIMLFVLLASAAHAKSNETYADVKIAAFDVRLNGVLIQNVVNRYPLIVYQDITYVPMTYYDSRSLDLQTTWTAKDGFSVAKGGSGDYHVYDTYINDKASLTIKSCSFISGP